jgi:hypothetical protein
MTESDTFNALKKSTYEVVYNKWVDYHATYILFDNDAFASIFSKHGWTQKEFWNEYYKRRHNRS